ncbi:hypothetical protein CARUB_v10017898mg [Capsella rubella]|uniref:Uncharacterized protein n=1 Tax=Capsella rubella TaxID=81985 RepID=R0FQ09_9BRAS|nr:uncharacterized protein LOC17886289 [Capsella rubella]EOA24627.1 hypothetical protein CARUB_v10017898mg [Capsella rubella]
MERDDDCNAYTASFSPSFSTYSGDRLSEIAERVCYREKSDEEFEFSITAPPPPTSSSSVFPVFNKNLISGETSPEKTVIIPLKDLFLREKEVNQPPQQTYSSSSDDDEEDEFEELPSEIYCPWTPARSMSPSGGCRKSKSTGSSSTSSWCRKKWRLRDLLKRSKSDGKQSLKFLNPTNTVEESTSSSTEKVVIKKKEKKKETVSVVSVVSAHEKFYLRNKAMKEEDKRKSYLPYKQDLVGLFSNIHRYGKTF